jgi:gluconate 5-dehydrogenase
MTQPLADNKDFNSWLMNRTPARRWGDPKELIGALTLLASDAGDFINGQIIYVDGGILSAL